MTITETAASPTTRTAATGSPPPRPWSRRSRWRWSATPSVFYLGEDVGAYGGIFSSTTGLLERFGPQRVIDTPISETAFIGLGHRRRRRGHAARSPS